MEHVRLLARGSRNPTGAILNVLRVALSIGSILLLGACSTGGKSPVVNMGSSNTKAIRLALEDASGRSKIDGYIDLPITDELTRLISKYDPEAAILLQRAEEFSPIGPPSYRSWISPKRNNSLGEIGQMDTALHEQNHSYQSRWPEFMLSQLSAKNNAEAIRFKQRNGLFLKPNFFAAFFFDRQRTDILQRSRLTPVRELVARIPAGLQTFRFPIYVAAEGDGKQHGSQTYGIYGLLEEYSSYYWDQRLRLALFPWFAEQIDRSTGHWTSVVWWTASTMPAFAEFRYFILEYLAMEKELHPDEYQKLMDDQDLRRTFTDLDDAYIALMNDVIAFASTTLPHTLEKKGIKVDWYRPLKLGTWTKTYDYMFWIESDGISSETVWQWNDYYILRKELQGDRLLAIADEFRLHPVAELPPLELPRKKSKVLIPKEK